MCRRHGCECFANHICTRATEEIPECPEDPVLQGVLRNIKIKDAISVLKPDLPGEPMVSRLGYKITLTSSLKTTTTTDMGL